jgi:hypothetical protein
MVRSPLSKSELLYLNYTALKDGVFFCKYDKIITKEKIRHIAEVRLEKEQKHERDLEIDDVLIECFDEWIGKKITPWMKEIVSDLIGLRIFGLAYFFAFLDTISQTQAIGGTDHPPTELRLTFLYF